MRVFGKGEIVAFEEKPTLFKYAKVISQQQNSGSLSRVEVQIGHSQTRELLSSQIYAFGSNVHRDTSNSVSKPATTTTTTTTTSSSNVNSNSNVLEAEPFNRVKREAPKENVCIVARY